MIAFYLGSSTGAFTPQPRGTAAERTAEPKTTPTTTDQ